MIVSVRFGLKLHESAIKPKSSTLPDLCLSQGEAPSASWTCVDAETTGFALQHVVQYYVSVLRQVFEFVDRLILNLPDTLPRESELFADTHERVRI